jgi:hypothetical protein
MTLTRVSLRDMKLVYVIVSCAKKLRYAQGRSRIAYIGTTKKGAARVATSAAKRARDVLRLHGVDSCEVRIVACTRRRNVKTWYKLEAALALMHREMFGEVPTCNHTFQKRKWGDLLTYFTRKKLRRIVEDMC